MIKDFVRWPLRRIDGKYCLIKKVIKRLSRKKKAEGYFDTILKEEAKIIFHLLQLIRD